MKFTSHKQHLLGLLFSIKVKKDSYRPGYTSSLLICPNLNDSQTFKSSSWKTIFLQCVCYRCSLLRWMFFVPCDNWKTLFFLKFVVTVRFFQPPYCRFILNKCFERSPCYSHNKSAVLMLIPILSSKIKLSYFYHAILCTWITFVADFFYDNVFNTLTFLLFLTFHYKWVFFEKLKTSLKACFYIIR